MTQFAVHHKKLFKKIFTKFTFNLTPDRERAYFPFPDLNLERDTCHKTCDKMFRLRKVKFKIKTEKIVVRLQLLSLHSLRILFLSKSRHLLYFTLLASNYIICCPELCCLPSVGGKSDKNIFPPSLAFFILLL